MIVWIMRNFIYGHHRMSNYRNFYLNIQVRRHIGMLKSV